jgi:hypothetical protein
MVETVRKVDSFYIENPDKPGEGAKVFASLRDAVINLVGFTAFPRRHWSTQIDFIPEDVVAFKTAARKAGLKLSAKKTGFLIKGEAWPGVFTDIVRKLAAVNVNITTSDVVGTGKGHYRTMLWVEPADVRKAAKALGAQ